MPVRFEDTSPQSPETTPTAPTRGGGRGRVLGVAGLVVLLVGTVVAALSARDDRPEGTAPTPAPTSTSTAAQGPAPVELPIGAAGEAVGATTAVAGVPAGFPQTTDGAVSAVLTYTNAAGRALFTAPDALEQIAAHIYTPQARATSSILTAETARIVREELNVTEDGTGRREDGSLDASRRAFAECLYEYGAYRVESSVDSTQEPQEVAVTTWAPCLSGVGSPSDSTEVQVRWSQATTTARWSGTDWQMDGTTFPEDTPPAPDEPRAVNVSFTERARLLGEGWTMPAEAREDFDLTIGLGYLR